MRYGSERQGQADLYELLLRMFIQLDEAADIRIAHHHFTRATTHGDDAIRNHLRARCLRACEKCVEAVDFESHVADADIADARGHDRLLAILKFDQLEIDTRTGHARLREQLVEEAQNVAVTADRG